MALCDESRVWLRWPAAPAGATSTGGEPASAVVGAAMFKTLSNISSLETLDLTLGATLYLQNPHT